MTTKNTLTANFTKIWHPTNDSIDMARKAVMFAEDHAPADATSVKIILTMAGTFQVSYNDDKSTALKIEASCSSFKKVVHVIEDGFVSFSSGYINIPERSGKYVANVGFAKPDSMTTDLIQQLADVLNPDIQF